jgi:hypothetical protein
MGTTAEAVGVPPLPVQMLIVVDVPLQVAVHVTVHVLSVADGVPTMMPDGTTVTV